MRYTIHNIRHKASSFDDDDYALFEFDVHFAEPEELWIKNYFVDFDWVHAYIKTVNPEFYDYIYKIRRGLDRWGNRAYLVLQAMEEEAIEQMYKYTVDYMATVDFLEKSFEQRIALRNQHPIDTIEQQMGMQEVIRAEKKAGIEEVFSNKRYYKFCETLEKQIRELAVEVYPDILDLPADKLVEFKRLFVRDIQALHERLGKFRWENKEK
ncbi:MAG: hypothetical protein NTX03_03455 [Bacteroidetes bacterium]|nr:hypothetical protein [Bacteroidota bacterium]